MKKKYYYIIILLSLYQNTLSYDWNIVSSQDDHHFQCLANFDSLHYTISGYYDKYIPPLDFTQYFFIKTTTDGGKTWDLKWQSNETLNEKGRKITELKMLSSNIIIAGMQGGLIIRTIDGGTTWDSTLFNVDSEQLCNSMAFDKRGFGMVDFYGCDFIPYTNDSGKTWIKMSKPHNNDYDTTNVIDDIAILDTNSFILSYYHFNDKNLDDDYHYIVYTNDKGKTWNYYRESDSYHKSFEFANKKIGYMGGYVKRSIDNTQIIKKTTDGGLTWTIVYQGIKSSQGIHYMYVKDTNTVYASTGKTIIYSVDGGITWEEQEIEPSSNLLLGQIQFGSPNTGLAISNHFNIYSYNSVNSVERFYNHNTFFKIYPNPLEPQNLLNINFSGFDNTKIKVEILNNFGIVINQLFDGFKSTDENSLQFQLNDDLSSGLYWIKISDNNGVYEVKPLLILK